MMVTLFFIFQFLQVVKDSGNNYDVNEYAADIDINSKRDMIRLIFICIYGRDKRSAFMIIPKNNLISSKGFTFKDFTIKKRVR